MGRGGKRKRRQRNCCAICGEVFPLESHYDAESYENLLLRHMMKCSASPAAVAAAAAAPTAAAKVAPAEQERHPPSSKATGNEKPPAKIHVTDDRKPAARKRATPKMSPTNSERLAAKSLLNISRKGDIESSSTKPSSAKTQGDKVNPRKTKDGVARKEATPSESPFKPLKRKSMKQVSPSQRTTTSDDTAATVSTTQDSSTATISVVSSTHFLAQTWWREKTVRKNPQVSMPFSLESCVATVADSNDTSRQEEVPTRERRRLRSASRPRNDSLAMSCPICRKPFTKFIPIVTEDAMSHHVERCSRKFMSETVPASRRYENAENSSSSNNMARNLAVVAALSRPRNQEHGKQTKEEKQKLENDRQARRAAEWAARRASMHFLTYGAGERALDDWVIGNVPMVRKKAETNT